MLGVTGSPVDVIRQEDVMAIRLQRTSIVTGARDQEAMAFAAEISTYLTESMGIPTTWGVQVGGTLGVVHWFAEYPDMAAMEAGLLRTNTDPGYLERLSKAAEIFLDGSTEDTIIYLM
jgi:hypothetical protein